MSVNVQLEKYKEVINDLYKFYQYFVINHFTKKIIPAPHIQELSKELMKMYRGDYQKLTVSMPPRHSKSSLITLAFPLWLISRDPTLKIMVINSTFTLSESFGIRIRDLFEQYGKKLGLKVSDKKHASGWLMFEDLDGNLTGGSIRLIGIGGQITGFDADWIIVDDLVKGIQDTSPTALDKTKDFFNGIVMQRVEPETRLIVLGTIWHSDDILSYLRSEHGDEYTIIDMPAYDDNKVLWPKRYDMDFFNTREKEMGTRLFQALYLCNPLDLTGEFFDLDYLQYNKEPTNITGTLRAYDIAYSESGDYTVGILGYKDDEDNFYIQDMVRGQFGNRNKKIVQETAEHDGQDTPIAIEYGVGAAAKLIANEWSNTLTNYTIKEIVPINAKEDRAFPLSNAIIDGKVICNLKGKAREDFLREFISFPDGGHDDIVDATAHCYNMLFRTSKKNITAAIIDL